MIPIKDRLKEALYLRQITASELAKLSGLNKGGISRYLSGEVTPKQSAIGAMATALHVSPAWLMGYDVERDSNEVRETTIDLGRLSPENLIRLISYYEGLIDSQEENK